MQNYHDRLGVYSLHVPTSSTSASSVAIETATWDLSLGGMKGDDRPVHHCILH